MNNSGAWADPVAGRGVRLLLSFFDAVTPSMSSRWSGTGFFFCFFLGDAGALLPLTLSSLLATLHFSEQSIQTHTLSDISHILYPPPSPPPHAVSPFTPYLALWPLALHIPLSVCFDVTSERAVCNAHYAAVTLYFVRLLSGSDWPVSVEGTRRM